MASSYFITITSQNHCGVLPAVTTALGELGGDMQHASQSVVHGLFTMTIAAHFPDHRTREVIQEHLLQVGRHFEMDVMIRELEQTAPEEVDLGETCYLSVAGRDAPGVVRVVSSMLAQQMISIDSLTALPDSPETFSMLMRLTVPPAVDLPELIDELELFGTLNGLDVEMLTEEQYYRSGLAENPTPTLYEI